MEVGIDGSVVVLVSKFPLKTTKQHSFKRWSEIYNFMVKGGASNKGGIQQNSRVS